MKVRVNGAQCMGHALCQAFSPEVFSVDEDSGENEMGEFEVPDERYAMVLRGLNACPERAIEILSGPAADAG